MSELKVGATWSQAKNIDPSTRLNDKPVERSRAEKAAKIVFIPGHWHTPYHVQPLILQLQTRGISTSAYQLESVGIKEPRPTFKGEVQAIVDVVMKEIDAGEDVVLVCHSYAGMPGAEAVNQIMKRLGGVNMPLAGKAGKGRLRRYVMIAAYVFPAGFEVDNKMFIGPEDPMFRITDDGFNLMLQPYEAFFNDMTKEGAQPFLENLAPVNYMPPPHAPVVESEDWRQSSVVYILCEKDAAMPLDRQSVISQPFETVRLDTGHDGFISAPDKVADILDKIAWET